MIHRWKVIFGVYKNMLITHGSARLNLVDRVKTLGKMVENDHFLQFLATRWGGGRHFGDGSWKQKMFVFDI